MATCEVGPCRIHCPASCICSWNPETEKCICWCMNSRRRLRKPKGLTLKSKIETSINCTKLTFVAQYFEQLFPNQFAIPASKMNKKIKLKKVNTSFAAIGKQVGLIRLKKTRRTVKTKQKRKR